MLPNQNRSIKNPLLPEQSLSPHLRLRDALATPTSFVNVLGQLQLASITLLTVEIGSLEVTSGEECEYVVQACQAVSRPSSFRKLTLETHAKMLRMRPFWIQLLVNLHQVEPLRLSHQEACVGRSKTLIRR